MIIRPEFVTNSVTVLFTALYFFIYRGSIMTAISWGAFQFTTKSHFDFKKVTFSLIILAIIPILLYNVFLESLKFAVLSINSETSWWFYIFIVAMLAFYGSFPKSMKHFLVANCLTFAEAPKAECIRLVTSFLSKRLFKFAPAYILNTNDCNCSFWHYWCVHLPINAGFLLHFTRISILSEGVHHRIH